MRLYDRLKARECAISVIGLGYVGLPLAIAFAEKFSVFGFDVNKNKIEAYQNGIDKTNEVGNQDLQSSTITFSVDESQLRKARFHIVAVPTPINQDRTPNLEPIVNASKILGRNLLKDSIVVYESTVYPGVTEEICIPILEKESGLRCGIDFKIGYSPERINPGDKTHTVKKTMKIVSGLDVEALEEIASVYGDIIEAGIYKAESIKVAEAAKVIENSQRDINIAFMNELSIIFGKMNIDTGAVLKAAETKWNFLNFKPGLVGGHCIGVDPYYLTYKAEILGYNPEVILAGRRINDRMGKYIAENVVKQLIKGKRTIAGARVLILGLTFKENVPDVRNTKVIDIIKELEEYQIHIMVSDPMADKEEAHLVYGIDLCDYKVLKELDAIVFAVDHEQYRSLKLCDMKKIYKENGMPVLIDVKSIFNKEDAVQEGYLYWKL